MGSGQHFKRARREPRAGKVEALLDAKLKGVEWGEFRIGDLFGIKNTLSFNKDELTIGNKYDYVTRTSQNQGILQTTGFVNNENINEAGCWSLGLLQMDFFYRHKSWYAGQFVRKIIPKFNLTTSSILFFTILLNKQKEKLLSVLVRNVDKVFKNSKIQLPIKNNEIDFEFMENFIAEIEAQKIARLEAYLVENGLKEYCLSDEEEEVLKNLSNIEFDDFNVVDIFDVRNSGNILSRDIVVDSGDVPYLCASSENNAVSSYISYDDKYLDKGDCVFIGGKTFVVTYQEKDFYSNDSHNLILHLKEKEEKNKLTQLFLATCVNKSLGYKYSWGDSISNRKIQKDTVSLPTKNNQPDYALMQTLISAVQKLVVKDVVLYVEGKRR